MKYDAMFDLVIRVLGWGLFCALGWIMGGQDASQHPRPTNALEYVRSCLAVAPMAGALTLLAWMVRVNAVQDGERPEDILTPAELIGMGLVAWLVGCWGRTAAWRKLDEQAAHAKQIQQLEDQKRLLYAELQSRDRIGPN